MKSDASEFAKATESGMSAPSPHPSAAPVHTSGYEQESMFVRADVLSGLLRAGDLLILVLVGIAAHLLCFAGASPTSHDLLVLFSISIAIVISLQIVGSYRLNVHFPIRQYYANLTKALLIGTMGIASYYFLFGHFPLDLNDDHRRWIALLIFGDVVAVVTNRISLRHYIQAAIHKGHLIDRIVVVGANERTEKVLSTLLEAKHPGIELLGVFEDRVDRDLPSLPIPVLGTTDDLVGYIRSKRVDRVIVTLPWVSSVRIDVLLQKLRSVPVRIELVPNELIWQFPCANFSRIGTVPLLTLANGRIDQQRGLAKRCEDLVISLLLALLASPLFLLIALLIVLDSKGPILFKQNRHGFNNKIFSVYKFRSMHVQEANPSVIAQATHLDARVTRVGRFLRRSSLDELPQLLNVIVGDMSIVGPRPHAVQHNILYGAVISSYFARHNVKPGITGWAQVNGLRGETDTDEKMRQRVEHDLYYIENWTLLSDLKIIVKTAIVVWFDKSAY